jgi:hypothetical protein
MKFYTKYVIDLTVHKAVPSHTYRGTGRERRYSSFSFTLYKPLSEVVRTSDIYH